jgi:flagellar protein FliS
MSPYLNSAFSRYQELDVMLASPARLIALLYGKILCCVIAAKQAFLVNDYPTRDKNISKAVYILSELIGSLNVEEGGAIALQLAALYQYIAKQLFMLRRESTTEQFDEVIRLLTPLKEAWETVAASHPASQP